MRKFISTEKNLSTYLFGLLFCLIVIALSVSTATATDNLVMSWNIQATGFRGTQQTAVAMRDGGVWPVIFSQSQNTIQAYSLYPVTNPEMRSNWFLIGTNLLPNTKGVLSAETSPDGSVGAVVRMTGSSSSSAIVGNSVSGFSGVMTGVQAIDFDKNGKLITGTLNTIPTNLGVPRMPLIDISVSKLGDIGVIDAGFNYYQNSHWMGKWGVTDLKTVNPNSKYPYPESLDLGIDSFGRPHVIGLMPGQNSQYELVAYDFDTTAGQWKTQSLSSSILSGLSSATLATDSLGGVGIAWVQANPNCTAQLMYSYKSNNDEWTSSVVANSVTLPNSSLTRLINPSQKVGLTYDNNDLPVISFLADSQVFLAYDPLVSVPEPSTLILLAMSGITMLLVYRKRQK